METKATIEFTLTVRLFERQNEKSTTFETLKAAIFLDAAKLNN